MQDDDTDSFFPKADKYPTDESALDAIEPLSSSSPQTRTGPYKSRYVELFERVHGNCVHTGMKTITIKVVPSGEDAESRRVNKRFVYMFDLEDGRLYKKIVRDDVHGQVLATSRLTCENPTEYASIINSHLVWSASHCDPAYRCMTKEAQLDYDVNCSSIVK